MENLTVYAPRLAPKDEPFVSGHRACIGCGEALAVRLVAKAMGRNTIVVNATGCMEIVASQLPYTSWKLPWIHTLFENSAAVASGVESALKALMRKQRIPREEINIVALAGDGATVDIGLQALSGAMERGHKMLFVCFDNEAYMNTGIQRSSATPFGASTTTSPAGKTSLGQFSWKKDMPAIAAAHHIPYMATACHSYPFDIMAKVRRALATPGPSYLHVFSVCPTGWRCAGDLSIRIGRLAVQTGVFPLYEVVDGKYTMSLDFPKLRPLTDYTRLQGRFKHLPPEVLAQIQETVRYKYNELCAKAQTNGGGIS